MGERQLHRQGRGGQVMTETVLLLPLYLLVVFFLLQLGQLSVALSVVNYSAGSIGRKAAQLDSGGVVSQTLRPVDVSAEAGMLKNVLTVGMYDPLVRACVQRDPTGGVTAEMTVWTSAKIHAFPFVGQFLHAVYSSRYAGTASGGCDDGDPSHNLGPFNFSADAPYYFVVRGKATTRMNYQPVAN